MTAATTLAAVWRAAVRACDPRGAVRTALVAAAPGDAVTVVAVGKAAAAMAAGAVDALGAAVRGGVVVVPDGVDVPPEVAGAGLDVRRAAHPVPDARSVAAGQALLAAAAAVPADGVLLALISGGASALAAVPRAGLTLAAKVAQTTAAMQRGAPIDELNRLRGALSAIKAGRLAAACPGRVLTLVVSDVPGDDVAVIGSGPTVPPRADRGDAVRLIAGLGRLRDEAAARLAAAGWAVAVRDAALVGDVAVVADEVAAVAARLAPGAAWVAGGEWTVTLPAAPGVGGRAVQLALQAARDLAAAGDGDVTVLVAGSDGVDGTGPAAGAIVDGATWAALAAAGVDGARAIAGCDAGRALAAVGATIGDGPTGVNHADLVIVVRGAG